MTIEWQDTRNNYGQSARAVVDEQIVAFVWANGERGYIAELNTPEVDVGFYISLEAGKRAVERALAERAL